MAQCDINELLADGQCYYSLSPQMRDVVRTALYCSMAQALIPIDTGNPALQSVDDGEWYVFNIFEVSAGKAIAQPSQNPTTPGATPYLVILNLTDGLKYKIQFYGAAGGIMWEIDPAATVEAETPTQLAAINGGALYTLDIVNDPGLTIELNPV